MQQLHPCPSSFILSPYPTFTALTGAPSMAELNDTAHEVAESSKFSMASDESSNLVLCDSRSR